MLKACLRGCLCILLFWVNANISGQQKSSNDMVYENNNQVEARPLELRSIEGVARDENGFIVSAVKIGIFTENGHTLIATTETDKKGQFAFKHNIPPPGRYRVVAQHLGFCTANVPIIIDAGGAGHPRKALKLHMVVGGIDSCSFGDLK
jgi:hypothetical protein